MHLRGLASGAACVLALTACGRSDPGSAAASSAPAAAQAPDTGYRSAPQVRGLARAPDASLSLFGRAAPSSQVRLASPLGARLETTADGNGDWRTPVGPVSEPALYGLSAESGGRRIQAEGYIAVLPDGSAAMLRAGAGAQVLQGGKATSLKLLAADVDGGGAAVISGVAPANAPVRILVDGQVAIEAPVGPEGRFSLTLPKALPPGQHQIKAMTAKASADAAVTVGSIAPLTDGPYRIVPANGGWRIDWMTPGEGLQTTLLLAAETER